MNARAEAHERTGGRYDARVLEPSPPTVREPPWFADDPIGREEPRGSLPRLLPVAGGELRWEDLCATDAVLAAWCAERWLAAYRSLGAVPSRLVETREALHVLAERVMAPARAHANGKIGLRYTRSGFGTPFFGADVQLRVSGDVLTVQEGERERSARIDSLAAMAAHVGAELLPGAPAGDAGTAADAETAEGAASTAGRPADEPLAIDPASSAFLGDWFGFAASVLEELRAGVGEELEPSRVQLWPEHFDLSVELGVETAGARAGYGASPGDELHAEPYLYVVPWGEVADGELWQASAFRGAELPYATLRGDSAQGDTGTAQRELALRFFSERLAALV